VVEDGITLLVEPMQELQILVVVEEEEHNLQRVVQMEDRVVLESLFLNI
jgi:hypothetical protein